MSRLRWLAALLSLAFLSACGGYGTGGGNTNPGHPLPTDSLSGTITFKSAPLAKTTVTNFLTNSNIIFKTTSTDTNGNYSFSGMQTGWDVPAEYQIYANKAGYGFYPSVGSGAKVMRADYTGEFQGSGIAPSGLFFNVIDFTALSENSVTRANFAAYDGSNPLVTLAATGQQISYAAGDDAFAKKGVAWDPATRFIDNRDGTVSDTLTGLIWLQDASCLGTELWLDALAAVNTLATGQCTLSDGSSSGSWRLPNINELESLIDVSTFNPALSPNTISGMSRMEFTGPRPAIMAGSGVLTRRGPCVSATAAT